MKIAITEMLELDAVSTKTIENLGFEIIRYPLETVYDGNADVIVGMHLPKETIPHNLKFAQLLSAGYDHINIELYKEAGVSIANGRGMYSIPIAEYCLAYILNHYKSIPSYLKQQAEHKWERLNQNRALDTAKVLILGTGSIAQETAKRLNAFNAQVDGVNSNGRSIEHFSQCFALDALDSYLPNYDIVICTLPSNDATYHIMDARQFGIMKNDAIFINIGRGACVNLEGLMTVLDTNLAGVVLDVFETEPLDANHPIWDHPKATITPHASFETSKINDYRLDIVMHNLKRFAEQMPLMNRII
ncbi:D-2-hydroxyacid dehydrogenase [Erysipelothrix aquatica]|uniref:D-2-hydroxyacid dehydrogenase n=1 Tax=Erysipelothrix aquatica TaxID=2683714 RepID=UPI001359264C|nr:D-2-hydroxyacid dehydrogenase [Erysipelothrix aquatica]